MRVEFNPAAIQALAGSNDVGRVVEETGEQVAARARDNARRRLTDRGGGGIESIQSRMVRDERGEFARVGWDAEHWYMGLHEVGSEHEPPRPFLRPALFAVRAKSGGKESLVRRVRTDKQANLRTRRNREAARRRRSG